MQITSKPKIEHALPFFTHGMDVTSQRLLLWLASQSWNTSDSGGYLDISDDSFSFSLGRPVGNTEVEKLLESLLTKRIQQKDSTFHLLSAINHNEAGGFRLFAPPQTLSLFESSRAAALSDEDRAAIRTLRKRASIGLYDFISGIKRSGVDSCIVSVAELRKILGVGQSKYPQFCHLKACVLSPCQAEILEKTPINFKFSEIHHGRTVSELEFTLLETREERSVRRNVDHRSEALKPAPSPGAKSGFWWADVIGRATKAPFLLTSANVSALLNANNWPFEYWTWCLDRAEDIFRSDGRKIQNQAAYTSSILQNSYATWPGRRYEDGFDDVRQHWANMDPNERNRIRAVVAPDLEDVIPRPLHSDETLGMIEGAAVAQYLKSLRKES